jgi:RNA polymerase sigma factor (sigma-70 family)
LSRNPPGGLAGSAVKLREADWAQTVDQLVADNDLGSRLAALKIAQLVTSLLAHWRAYDFRDEWDDLVQEVLLGVALGARAGRIRTRAATLGYIRQIARNKFMDRLRRQLGSHQAAALAWEDAVEEGQDLLLGSPAPADVVADVRHALDNLAEKKRKVVYAVYGEKRTYEQVAADTGIPLGTVKRYLREALGELRAQYRAQGSKP